MQIGALIALLRGVTLRCSFSGAARIRADPQRRKCFHGGSHADIHLVAKLD
jgi:hypothetical protein